MLFIDHHLHIQFVASELRQLLPEGSFASRLKQTIGHALHYRLVDWPVESETELSRIFPVDALFAWVTTNGGLNPESLVSDDGRYLDDKGEEIPRTLRPDYSAVEQMAVYGLWFLDEEMESLGPMPETDTDGPIPEYNGNGWTLVEVLEHRSACLLFAYQALSYCRRILGGTQLTLNEEARAEKFSFSAMGRLGAKKRHAPMAELKSWAIQKYREKKWKSANQAAHALKSLIMDHGRTIDANLSEENAQRTIADWFRKSA